MTTVAYGLKPASATRKTCGSPPCLLGGDGLGRDVALLARNRVGEKSRDAAVVGNDLHALPGEFFFRYEA